MRRPLIPSPLAVSLGLLIASMLPLPRCGTDPVRFAIAALLPGTACADPRPQDALNAAELRQALRKLRVTGSVLYVGAHPDDDHTGLLACLARGRLLRTAYVSLTRGDGGQNILGTETGDALGVMRTQELLASRRVDGAEQFFARALDFGFSKSPDEALAIWDHQRVLGDLVWVIRRFRPDVILTRFGTDGSGGHGHHTASAILAGEAFAAAADSSRFPDQLAFVKPWQARRLLWNTWAPKLDGRDPKLPPLITLDIGLFDAELGLSYPEIGGRARSLNRSQGAGTPERRGAQLEYFEPVAGQPAAHDLFDGVDVSWGRLRGSRTLDSLLALAERAFDPDHPAAVLPQLARAHAALLALSDEPLVAAKRVELERVMRSCAGLWLEANAETPTVNPGDSLGVTLTALNRSDAPLRIERIEVPHAISAFYAASVPPNALFSPGGATSSMRPDSTAPVAATPRALATNRAVVALARLALPSTMESTQPYWLRRPSLAGSFDVDDLALIGTAENTPAVAFRVTLDIAGARVAIDVPVTYRWTDRVYGDRYRALEVVPPVTVQLDQVAYLFGARTPREVRAAVQSTHRAADGLVRLALPAGWTADPSSAAIHVTALGEQVVRFRVTPAPGAATGRISASVEVGGRTSSSRLQRIDQPHIPIQTLLFPSESRMVHADIAHTGSAIGYLMGSGDQIPDALRQMGFTVTLLGDDDVENGDLSRFDCIVAGVRAYNTRPRLRALQPRLLEYVEKGGRLVVQYVTPEDALNDRLGPWPFKISRDRVTDENAEMRLLKPAHALLTKPNRITAEDFDGWVQERGLSYAGPFDSRYETVLSANDPGEPARDGGLLYAHYGRGVFIYTGLAWFRQLPAGVPGAWRLFANLVSTEK